MRKSRKDFKKTLRRAGKQAGLTAPQRVLLGVTLKHRGRVHTLMALVAVEAVKVGKIKPCGPNQSFRSWIEEIDWVALTEFFVTVITLIMEMIAMM